MARNFGPWAQICGTSSQESLRKYTTLMSSLDDAPTVEVLKVQLRTAQSEIESKQLVIDTLEESIEDLKRLKDLEVTSLEESNELQIEFWEKLYKEKDRSKTNLEMKILMTMARNHAIERTRIIIEYIAAQSRPGTICEATTTLLSDLFLNGNLNSNELCAKGKEWLADLVYPEPLSTKLEEDVCTALRKKSYEALSFQSNYIDWAPKGLYLGVGPKADRYSQALLVLQAQLRGAHIGKVDFLIEREVIRRLMYGRVQRKDEDNEDDEDDDSDCDEGAE